MAPQTINILLTTFGGLGLPPTVSIPVSASSTISDVTSLVWERLPEINNRLFLTTISNRGLSSRSGEPITSLLSSPEDGFLPLRLSAPLCGGKGGFGSQLRAQGGRMSAIKKRRQGENNGSNRNLQGRRLRTEQEVKNLAEYMAKAPAMEKAEREEKRKRWEAIVESSERKQEEMLSGRNARLDGKWVEAKEEAAERTREAVLTALKNGDIKDVLAQRESDSSPAGSGESEESEEEVATASSSRVQQPALFGWDEYDEFMSEGEEDDEVDAEEDEEAQVVPGNKGKAKA